MQSEGLEGHVDAASVAQARWQPIYGRQVFSSIWRVPSPEPLYFASIGPKGNSTAVHRKVVHLFSSKIMSIGRSSSALSAQWGDCIWGENTMLSGFREEGLHIGDRFEVGVTVLEIASHRIPCFKLCWRMSQAEEFLPGGPEQEECPRALPPSARCSPRPIGRWRCWPASRGILHAAA